MDRGAWQATCPWGRTQSDMTERLSTQREREEGRKIGVGLRGADCYV